MALAGRNWWLWVEWIGAWLIVAEYPVQLSGVRSDSANISPGKGHRVMLRVENEQEPPQRSLPRMAGTRCGRQLKENPFSSDVDAASKTLVNRIRACEGLL